MNLSIQKRDDPYFSIETAKHVFPLLFFVSRIKLCFCSSVTLILLTERCFCLLYTSSMEQVLSEVLDHKYKYLNFFEQVNELLTKPVPDFIERIQYKSSFDFISSLDRFILHIENHYFRAEDVKLTQYITVPAEFIEEQFHRFNRYPMRQRFEAMTEYMPVSYTHLHAKKAI